MPDPKNYKTKKDFMAACVPMVLDEGTAKDSDQAVAMCINMWKKRDGENFKMEKEVRVIPVTEMRVTKRNDEDPIIEGYAALFNNWSDDLGGFRERIKPGAFKKAIQTSDTRALFNHDSNYVLGRKSAGTLKLSENSVGLRMKIQIPDTQWARDLIVSINRGDISQSSFGFIVEKDGDEWKEDRDGNVTRTITEFKELLDVSPVTFPAYPDTKVALRSLEEFRNKDINKDVNNEIKQPDSEIAKSEQDEAMEIHQSKLLRYRLEMKEKILNMEDS